MRKKGKPNPAQKYFQLVVNLRLFIISSSALNSNGRIFVIPNQHPLLLQVSLDAVIKNSSTGVATTPGLQTVPLVQMISERIIVRASNPGQFDNIESMTEANGGASPWSKDPTSGTLYHIG